MSPETERGIRRLGGIMIKIIEANTDTLIAKAKRLFQEYAESLPGPYLELFARRARKNWDVFGNDIEEDLFNVQRRSDSGRNGQQALSIDEGSQ